MGTQAEDMSDIVVTQFRAGLSVLFADTEGEENGEYAAMLALQVLRNDGEVFEMLLKRDGCERLLTAIGHVLECDPDKEIATLLDHTIADALK